MKSIYEFLLKNKTEKHIPVYQYSPKTRRELKTTIEQLLDGGITDLNCIDVSAVTEMDELFSGLHPEEIDISEWDMSRVSNTYSMFWGCSKMTCDIENWDVSAITDMRFMFGACRKFCCDLSAWNISPNAKMDYAFDDCTTLRDNGMIPSWFHGIIQ